MSYVPPSHHFERVTRLIAGRVADAGAEYLERGRIARHPARRASAAGRIRPVPAAPRHIDALFDLRAERLFVTRAVPADIVLDAQPDATEGFDLLEREHIKQALTQTQWRAALAAPLLGISRATLYRRIARFKIVAPHRL